MSLLLTIFWNQRNIQNPLQRFSLILLWFFCIFSACGRHPYLFCWCYCVCKTCVAQMYFLWTGVYISLCKNATTHCQSPNMAIILILLTSKLKVKNWLF